MSAVASLDRTNSVSNRDWLNVSKHLTITAHEPSKSLAEASTGASSKAYCEHDLKKAGTKEPDR
jgi:hypothetical protein